MTPAVRLLMILNFAVYVIQLVVGDALIAHFALWPLGRHYVPGLGEVGFEPWQLFTSAFLHGGFAHIALNMYALLAFGSVVERAAGTRRFGWLYFASVLSAGLVQLVVVTAALDQGVMPTIGASGGVFGVLLAFAVLFPHSRVMLLFPPIPMKAWVLVSGYALIELASGILGSVQGVAHFAHLGGMLGAGLLLYYWGQHRTPAPR